MAIATLKGIVKEVLPVEYYGEGNTGRKQTLVLHVPGYTNQYGEKVTKDETWGVDIFNKKIDEFGLNNNCLSKKAEVEVYLSGREYTRLGGEKGFSISATLKSIKLGDIVETSHNTDDAHANAGDLPF